MEKLNSEVIDKQSAYNSKTILFKWSFIFNNKWIVFTALSLSALIFAGDPMSFYFMAIFLFLFSIFYTYKTTNIITSLKALIVTFTTDVPKT